MVRYKIQLNTKPGSNGETEGQKPVSYRNQITSMDTVKRLKRQPQKRENVCKSYT